MAGAGTMRAAAGRARRAAGTRFLLPSRSRIMSTSVAPDAPSTSTSAPHDDLGQFLARQKADYRAAAAQQRAREWCVVMGNEAGDLDSLASAIAYAWYAATHLHTRAVPLLQVARADLVLRAENLSALARAGVDPAALLTADELPAPSDESFALVDHNRLGPRFASDAEARVVGIVDHHADEAAHARAQPRVVEPAGSCASLVARLLQSSSAPAPAPPRALATLLVSAIALDTGGLKDNGKALPVDRAAAAFLLPHAALAPASASELLAADGAQDPLRALHAELQAQKGAVAHLSPRDLLRRDYKEYTYAVPGAARTGLATVPRGLKAWLTDAPDFWEACRAYADERGLAALGVLTTWRDAKGKHRREQAWLVREGEGAEGLAGKLWAGLEGAPALRLRRKDKERYACAVQGFEGRVYAQEEAGATRKVTAPLVKEIIEGGALAAL